VARHGKECANRNSSNRTYEIYTNQSLAGWYANPGIPNGLARTSNRSQPGPTHLNNRHCSCNNHDGPRGNKTAGRNPHPSHTCTRKHQPLWTTRRYVPDATCGVSYGDARSTAAKYTCTISARGWKRNGTGALTPPTGTVLNTHGHTAAPTTNTAQQEKKKKRKDERFRGGSVD